MRASQTQDKFIVRLPDGMREKISQAAEANNRSMTAEIVSRLGKSFDLDGASQSLVPDKQIEAFNLLLRQESEQRQALEIKLQSFEVRLQYLEETR